MRHVSLQVLEMLISLHRVCASFQLCNVAGTWKQSVCVSMRACVPTLLTQYLEHYWSYFHKTYSTDAFLAAYFWGQKVKVQGHSGINYARNCTLRTEACST